MERTYKIRCTKKGKKHTFKNVEPEQIPKIVKEILGKGYKVITIQLKRNDRKRKTTGRRNNLYK
jgi:(2Fe-2S) ferredoxin